MRWAFYYVPLALIANRHGGKARSVGSAQRSYTESRLICVFLWLAYTVQINSIWREAMDTTEWVARCSARLHAQWPRLQREQRDEVARDIWKDQRWQHSEPEVAVVEWLSQGIPTPIGSDL